MFLHPRPSQEIPAGSELSANNRQQLALPTADLGESVQDAVEITAC
jgi:hypothetical protein